MFGLHGGTKGGGVEFLSITETHAGGLEASSSDPDGNFAGHRPYYCLHKQLSS